MSRADNILNLFSKRFRKINIIVLFMQLPLTAISACTDLIVMDIMQATGFVLMMTCAAYILIKIIRNKND